MIEMTKHESQPIDFLNNRNEVYQENTEKFLNSILGYLELPGIKIDTLSLEEAKDIKTNLDPRTKNGQIQSRQVMNEQGKSRIPEDLASIIYEYAEASNMTYGETKFLPGNYVVMCALGGANKAPYDRARSILEAIRSGIISTDIIVFSGSPRTIGDSEKQKSCNYAPGAETETDLARGALSTLQEEYGDLIEERGIKLELMETAEGTYTATEIEQLIDRYNLPKDARVGLQTTQIYQPFTQLDASAVGIKRGVEIVVAGHASSASVVESRKPETYLSELTNALLASVRLNIANNSRLL